MMGAADPTYPLYPIACILASTLLLLVLMTSFIRQSSNLSVILLCFWLFLENITNAVNAVVWANNGDVKLYIYCDIVTHIQLIAYVVKPASTLLLTRRLYLIAKLQSIELPGRRRWNLAVEWTLGLIVPMLIAGPIYYVNQGLRFEIFEGFGCATSHHLSMLDILVIESWTILPPLVSIVFYYPKVVCTYYQQRRDINTFLRSDPSVPRTNYFRILAIASIDILLTLPIGVVNITFGMIEVLSPSRPFSFYPGWTFLHNDWDPRSFSYSELRADGTAALVQNYLSLWSSPVLAFTIFGLLGLTSEACTSYWRIICTFGSWFGWKPSPRARNRRQPLDDIEFGTRQQDTSGIDLEMGSRPPSFIDTNMPATNGSAGHTISGGRAARGSDTDLRSIDEARREEITRGAESQDAERRTPSIDESSDFMERAGDARAGSSMAAQGTNITENDESALEPKED